MREMTNAYLMPIHWRLPFVKGTRNRFSDDPSPDESSHLSGSNRCGSGNTLGSKCIRYVIVERGVCNHLLAKPLLLSQGGSEIERVPGLLLEVEEKR